MRLLSGCRRSGRLALEPATAGDATALPLRSSAPHAVVDPVVQRVLQARRLHRAVGAYAARDLNANTVVREERCRRDLSAFPLRHPYSVHHTSVVLSGTNAGG